MNFIKQKMKSLGRFLGNLKLAGRQIFWKNRKTAFLIWLALIFNFLSFGLLALLWRLDQPILILHYNAFLGIDQMIDVSGGFRYLEIFLAPIGGLIFWIFNFFLVLFFYFQGQSWEAEESDAEKKTAGLEGEKVVRKRSDLSEIGVSMLLGASLILEAAVLIYCAIIFWVNGR